MNSETYNYIQIATFNYGVDLICEIKILKELSSDIWNQNAFTYSQFTIPDNISKILTLLIDKYNLSEFKEEFFTLLILIQDKYFEEQHHLPLENQLDHDIVNINNDLELLLNVLEEYLFATSKNSYKSIYLKKSNSKSSSVISNHFIISDIYNALLEHYDLNKENFQSQRLKILSRESTTNIIDRSREFMIIVVKEMFKMLVQKDLKQTQALKFIGVFLNIAQIPNSSGEFVELYEDLTTLEDLINVKNLRNYIIRN